MADWLKELERKANMIRHNIVEMIGVGHRGHYGGSLSCADIIAALYFYKMKHDPGNPAMEERDRLVLSKGHSVPAQYAALAECGYFPREELRNFKKLESMLQGHPDMMRTPGIEANTGSLGQGLSIANGMAIGLKMDGKTGKIYVITGDGELDEGQVWEAAMAAAHYKLDNVAVIVDKNNIQAMGPTGERLNTAPLKEKWQAFGWHAMEIDGHNMREIVTALDESDKIKGKPVVIIANTVKGRGVKIAENTAAFHNNEMNLEQYQAALADLEKETGDG